MNIFIVIVLFALTISSGSSEGPSLRTVLVVPQGEELTVEEQLFATQATSDAAAFWERNHPGKPSLPVQEEVHIIHVPADAYVNFAWANPWSTSDPLTIFILDNSSSGKLLAGQTSAFAMGEVYATIRGSAGAETLPATIAHEIGHARFGLHDQYPPYVPTLTRDIMSVPLWAYHDDVIGCSSLAALSYPCQHIYLTLILR